MSTSHRKSTQMHTKPGQAESQADPSFQLSSTCESVLSGLKRVVCTAVELTAQSLGHCLAKIANDQRLACEVTRLH